MKASFWKTLTALVLAVMLLTGGVAAAQARFPERAAALTDDANALSQQMTADIAAYAQKVEDVTGVKLNVVLVHFLDGEPVQTYADALFARCWPIIRDAWRWERDALTSEYLILGSQVVHTPLVIYYKPTSPKAGERIVCEARSYDGKLGERIQRMNEIIRILYGSGSGVAYNYYWEPGGTSVGDLDWQRGFSFEKKGKYTVKVRLEVAPYTGHTETEPRVMLRRTVPALVDIEVGSDKPEICKSCGQPIGTSPNCMNCILYNHDPNQ